MIQKSVAKSQTTADPKPSNIGCITCDFTARKRAINPRVWRKHEFYQAFHSVAVQIRLQPTLLGRSSFIHSPGEQTQKNEILRSFELVQIVH